MKCSICGIGLSINSMVFVNNEWVCKFCIPSKDKPKEENKNWNKIVSPKSFSEFIGQERIKREMTIMIEASKIHGIPVRHTLLSGSFGLGKTALANIFAAQIGDYDIVNAANIDNKLSDKRVIIIDEIHKLQNEEWLLGIMDSENRTIIGTTTTAGSLSGPLRSRFISLVLEPYTNDELAKIVNLTSSKVNFNCPDFLAQEIAKRSKSVARIAVVLFGRIYDRLAINKYNISKNDLYNWFNDMGIDEDGLDNADRAYLACLSDKPVGLQAICATIGYDITTVEETIEPYLMRRGFVIRTPKGRILGNKIPKNVWK